jgi:hypothetical protein
LETERTIGQDWVVRHDNRFFQVTRESGYAPARAKVVVCEWQDGRLEIRYRDKRLGFEEIPARPARPAAQCLPVRRRHPAPPTSSHPWRKGYQKMRAQSARTW